MHTLSDMSARNRARRVAGPLAFCATAILGGAATGKYTDVARVDVDLSFSPPKALAVALPSSWGPGEEGATAPATLAEPEGTAELDVSGVGLDAVSAAAPDARVQRDETTDSLASTLRGGKLMTGATPHRLILFTFDDGPSRFTTPQLLDRLDASGVRAVFFLTGANLRGDNAAERQHQAIARDTVERGHIVASHGFMHRQLPLLDDRAALAELTATEEIFERVLGGRPWLFRPPGGAHSRRTDRLVAARGYTTVLWNLGTGDYQVRSAEQVHRTFRNVLAMREAQGQRGGIVLMHDTYPWSVKAFQLIVDDLLARNCELLETDEELYDFVDDPRYFFEPRRGADANAESGAALLDAQTLGLRQARLRADTAQRCAGVPSGPAPRH